MKLSVSKIEEYTKCPYSYYLTNIKKAPIIGPEPRPLTMGKEIHELFDHAYDVPELNPKAIALAVTSHAKYKEYKEHCDNFIKFNYDKKAYPLHREIKLHDEELDFTGVIDRVDWNGKSLAIIDYKTGRNDGIAKHRFQLAVYAYLFEKNHNKPVTHWGIYFSKEHELVLEVVDREEMRRAVARIVAVRAKIQDGLDRVSFPKNPGWYCKGCRYYPAICDGKIGASMEAKG